MAAGGKPKVPAPVERPVPKVCAFHMPGGKVVRLGDIPLGVLARIAEEHNRGFVDLISQPLIGTGADAEALYRAACDVAGVTAPDPLTATAVYDAVHLVDKEGPTEGDQTTG